MPGVCRYHYVKGWALMRLVRILTATAILFSAFLFFNAVLPANGAGELFDHGKAWGPPQSQIKVTLALDRHTYRIGDRAAIKLSASQNCYFYLYSVDAGGKAVLLCPSSFCQNNYLVAGQEYTLRDINGNLLEQKGPAGREKLQVVVTREPLDMAHFSNYLEQTPTFYVVSKPSAFVGAVTRDVQGLIGQTEKQWGPSASKPVGVYGFAADEYSVESAGAHMLSYVPPEVRAKINVQLHLNKDSYRIGEPSIITLVADQDCYFVLYYVDSQGKAAIVSPSNFCASRQLKKDDVLIIKDNEGNLLAQNGPPGSEYLQVIASAKPIDMTKFQNCLDHTATVVNVKDPDLFITMLTKELKDRVEEQKKKGSTPGVFGVDSVRYEVFP